MAVVSVALLGVLLALVEGDWSPLARLDQGWVAALHRFASGHTAWTAAMRTLADLGGPVVMRSLLAVAAVWLWTLGARALAGWAAAQALLGWAVGNAGRALVDRPRPHFADPVASVPGGSFPSGHAMASAITCGVLLALLWPRADRVGRAVAAGIALAAVLAVGWTRIALGVHYPSDVLAGWLAAAAVLTGLTVAVELWRPGALLRDARRVDWRTRPRVQRVLAGAAPAAEKARPGRDRDGS
ncbi:phosphatase PAP2 family protein [Kitasatospora sp. NPDC049285]|uniref:phosphatase PAP2 family protein n=1 Tax=Kitasatospora sp. NPDC049285 TaxID=3157096 RepID=UPI00341EE65E